MNGDKAVRSYRDLIAWQKALDLVEVIYKATQSWPKEETYGLTSQIRRAVVSIPSNIAEGQGRASTREYLHHLSIARGSLLEVETQALIAQRLGYIQTEVIENLLANSSEVSRTISGLCRSLTARQSLTPNP